MVGLGQLLGCSLEPDRRLPERSLEKERACGEHDTFSLPESALCQRVCVCVRTHLAGCYLC